MHNLIPITPSFLREEVLRMTQGELAELVGVSARTVARWESGQINVRGLKTLASAALTKGFQVVQPGGQLHLRVPAAQSATTPGQAPEPGSSRPAEPSPPGGADCPT